MNTLTIKLKQHTPLIHFQHDQEGATLRASEVKPKLDRFILTQLGAGDYEKGKAEAKANGWLVGKGDHPALDYKMRIVMPEDEKKGMAWKNDIKKERLYFGNMNNDNPKDFSYTTTLIDLVVFSKNANVFNEVKNKIVAFFLLNNFGTRQSKGFGSYSVFSIDGKNIDISEGIPVRYISYFKTTEDNVFKDIEWIHKTLRSGINGKSPNSLYFKSLLFSYAESKREIWDKKSIKSHFLSEDTKEAVEETRNANLSRYAPLNKGVVLPSSSNPDDKRGYRHWRTPDNIESGRYDMRDYLGLSTNEAWMAYDNGCFEEKNGKAKTKPNKDFRTGKIINYEYVLKKMKVTKSLDPDFKDIGRFKSPILYKPVEQTDGKWRVYILADDESVKALTEKKVYYKCENMPHAENFSLPMWPSFSVKAFLDWSFSLEKDQLKNHFSAGRKPFKPDEHRNKNDVETYQRILELYADLKNNLYEK